MEGKNFWEKRYKERCTALQGAYDVIIPTELETKQLNERVHLTPRFGSNEYNGQLKDNSYSKPGMKKPPTRRSAPLAVSPRPLPTVSLVPTSDKGIFLAPKGTVLDGFGHPSGIRKIKTRCRIPNGSFTENSISVTDLRDLNRFSTQLSHKWTTKADIEAITCQLYTRYTQPTRNLSLLYATNQHGSTYTGYQKHQSGRTNEWRKLNQVRSTESYTEDTRGQAKKVAQPRGLPHLPETIAPEDYICSWLLHGSLPRGQSHFPNIK